MPTYVAITPYADRTYANAYFAERLSTVAWDNASNGDKDKALKMATLLIDQLPYIGYKNDESQAREFPRNNDTEIPQEVAMACAEVAKALLEGNNLESLYEKSGISSESQGGASASYTGNGPAELLGACNGLPSPMAARLLNPWLRDFEVINLTRV